MPLYLSDEPAEAMLAALGEALDLVECGIMLLDADMRVRFVNLAFTVMTAVEPPHCPGVPLRDVLGAQFEAEARSLPGAPIALALPGASPTLIDCLSTSNGGYILTCGRAAAEAQHAAGGEEGRLVADMRFDKEVWENQAAYLATLAEESDANRQRAEQARCELEHEIARRRQLEAKLVRLATTDPLTGTLNRRQFFELGQDLVGRRSESKQRFGLLLIDIDHFKAINDQHGHPAGDAALKHMVGCLRAELRKTDLIGRLGGEEFAIALQTGATDVALRIAERLRTKVATSPLEHGSIRIEMTISIGLAMARDTDDSLEQIIARADAELYRAKESGRNRVCLDEPPAVSPAGCARREAAAARVGERAG
jgi:diguanylate cyclase (GGDEF)-like protein